MFAAVRRRFLTLSPRTRRAAFALAAGSLVAYGVFVAWNDPLMTVTMLIGFFGAVQALLRRAFGAKRLKGLIAAASELKVPFEVETGRITGRLRGIPIHVFPTLNNKTTIEVSSGLELAWKGEVDNPVLPETATAIVKEVERLVAKAEAMQARLVERAASASAAADRRAAVRTLASIDEDARIDAVAGRLIASLSDADPTVRLAATAALKRPPSGFDQAWLLRMVIEDDEPGRDDAAAALGQLGDVEALAPLVATRDRGGEVPAIEGAIAAIRARTGVSAGAIAVADGGGGELSVAAARGALAVPKTTT